jgi:hypothetical protein
MQYIISFTGSIFRGILPVGSTTLHKTDQKPRDRAGYQPISVYSDTAIVTTRRTRPVKETELALAHMLLKQFAVVIKISVTRSARRSSRRSHHWELTFANVLAENNPALETPAAAIAKRDGSTVRSSEDSRHFRETCMLLLPV